MLIQCTYFSMSASLTSSGSWKGKSSSSAESKLDNNSDCAASSVLWRAILKDYVERGAQ